jgi:hypothetical protein
MKLDQLTEDISGNDARIERRCPAAMRSATLGMTPSLARRSSKPQGTPSKPTTQTRCFALVVAGIT